MRPAGQRAVSRQRFLERFATTLTGDEDAAPSEHPCDAAADPWMAGERSVPVPHRPLEPKGQLITTAPPLDVDQPIALETTESAGSGCASPAGATRERNDRDRCTAARELLPHSPASRELAPPGPQPCRVRPGSLTTRRRVAPVARQRLARRARALSPAPRDVQRLRRTPTLPRVVPTFSAARPRRRAAMRTPLIQPCAAIAHRHLPPRQTALLYARKGRRDPGAPLMHPKLRRQWPLATRASDENLPLSRAVA
jgi:hypothetical protein